MSVRILQGDCRDVLPTLAAGSVQSVVTSPPYWGLRDYGTGTWDGGDADCDHFAGRGGHLAESVHSTRGGAHQVADAQRIPFRGDCGRCGARRIDQQLGLEPTPEEYVARMVEVFRAVRRVLRADGTCWVNMGDGYGYDKQLVGMPWRLAFALQADGWFLRADIVWAKPNPMPESVVDRPTKAHEYIFLLSKSARYFYDADAVREPHVDFERGANGRRVGCEDERPADGVRTGTMNNIDRGGARREYNPAGRNLRSVWTIPSAPCPDAHFATFPPALASRCLQAGTSERGCCAACGAPWARQIEREVHTNGTGRAHIAGGDRTIGQGWQGTPRASLSTTTTGWQPSCACEASVVPCTVLDPFGGSGTVGAVAEQLGRHSILIELSPEYVRMAERRTAQRGLFAREMAAG